jgi:hypothetical protein
MNLAPRSRSLGGGGFVMRQSSALDCSRGVAAQSLIARQDQVKADVCLYYGEALGRYGFPHGHPLGVDRQGAFFKEAVAQKLGPAGGDLCAPQSASRAQIERFHTSGYVEDVLRAETDGREYLDNGDTPVFLASTKPVRWWLVRRSTVWRTLCAHNVAPRFSPLAGCTMPVAIAPPASASSTIWAS